MLKVLVNYEKHTYKILLMKLTVVTAKQSILVILNDFKIAFR